MRKHAGVRLLHLSANESLQMCSQFAGLEGVSAFYVFGLLLVLGQHALHLHMHCACMITGVRLLHLFAGESFQMCS